MNFLKKLFLKKKQKSDNNIVIRNYNLASVDDSLSNIDTTSIEESYPNRLSWWHNLPDEWKRLLMMKSNLDDPMQYDISAIPSEAFFNELFKREVFHSMLQRVSTLQPLTVLKKIKVLIVDFIEVEDFKEIAGMTNITTIIADNSKIESIEGIESFDNLEKLTLVNNDVTTLLPIATLRNLKNLDIRGTLINPQEVDMFRSLHPSCEISFITPLNPLRRNESSLENEILDYYKKMLNRDKKKEEALFKEGVRLSKKNQLGKAISKFNEVLEINPKNFNCLMERAYASHNSGDINNAIEDINILIDFGTILPKEYSLYYRGRLYMDLGELDKALYDYQSALKINPKYEESYLGIREIYLKYGNVHDIIEVMNSLISINPSNSNYYFDRGMAYIQLNDFNKVIQDMNKVLELSPNDSEALYYRGLGKFYNGQEDSAHKDLLKSRKFGFKMAYNFLKNHY